VFDHVDIRVSDRAASEAFYTTVLRTLGVEQQYNGEDLIEWENDFSIVPADADHPVTRRLHIAWFDPTRDDVRPFCQAGVDAGYRDDGAPGERPEYHAGYYGAYVLDPDGNNVEVVNHNR
jgi:catechol 2,3-dioxygenase-like lactoylglutathione lyase family enzyme